jgi:hypothetical protein
MENLIGEKFGRWTVRAQAESRRKKQYWLCQCDCGTIKEVKEYNMLRGASQSCGCYKIEQAIKALTKHGQSKAGKKTRTYHIWCLMRQRCYDTNNPAYPDYGGRGITVCDRWLESFENFYEDMGDCPKGMTIERVDNDDGYYKDNCKWVTRKEQCSNRRSNIWLTLRGERKTMSQWADKLGIKHGTLSYRHCQGWSDERILTTPVMTYS